MIEQKRKLKICDKNSAYTWMEDIPFCPYCNLSPEARIYYDQKNRDREKVERQGSSKK